MTEDAEPWSVPRAGGAGGRTPTGGRGRGRGRHDVRLHVHTPLRLRANPDGYRALWFFEDNDKTPKKVCPASDS